MHLTSETLDSLYHHVLYGDDLTADAAHEIMLKSKAELQSRRTVKSRDLLSVKEQANAGNIAVYVEPRAARGATKPRAIPDILKPGAALDMRKSTEELLAELGLD